MKTLASRILGSRGIHYLASRFGWKKLRGLAFDAKFVKGDWVFTEENPDLVRLVEKYSSNGHILALGCGTAPIARALNPARFQSFTGVDLSAEAIHLARKYSTEKIQFECGDMRFYDCMRTYDLILFPDSLNYVDRFYRKKLLRRLDKNLSPGGWLMVSLSQSARYANIIKLIRGNFKVEVDRLLDKSHGHVLVFR